MSSAHRLTLNLTLVMGDNMVKVISWYDNEWGYSQRVVAPGRNCRPHWADQSGLTDLPGQLQALKVKVTETHHPPIQRFRRWAYQLQVSACL